MDFSSSSSSQFPTVLSGLNLLLVEDDPDIRTLFEFVLGQHGAAVEAVESAGAAIEALDRRRFDALVSDIGLPDEDGYALIAKVRARAPASGGLTPAVAVTAFADAESRALAAGFQAFVRKPAEIDELASVIAMVARRVEESRLLLETLAAHASVQRSLVD